MIKDLNQLNDEYCQSLNEAWLYCTETFSTTGFLYKKVEPLFLKLKEAIKDGYSIKPQFQIDDIFDRKILNTPVFDEIYNFPGWGKIIQINSFIEDSEKTLQNWCVPDLKTLKKHYFNETMRAFILSYVKQNGPFYMSEDKTCINVYVFQDAIALEVLLLRLLKPYGTAYDAPSFF